MKQTRPSRFVFGLILLAALCTIVLGLQERRSAPLSAYSPVSPLVNGPGALDRIEPLLARLQNSGVLPAVVFQRAFWLKPWPWIAAGVVGFGLLALGLIWGLQRMERR
jgi:hypothetical protein